MAMSESDAVGLIMVIIILGCAAFLFGISCGIGIEKSHWQKKLIEEKLGGWENGVNGDAVFNTFSIKEIKENG